MVEAARKYKRIVQAGTMQRSGGYFQKAAEIVKSGELGEITFCHAYQAGTTPKEGYGNPPDSRSRRSVSTGICGSVPRRKCRLTRIAGA